MISPKYPNKWIPEPNRTSEVFPSGLVKISQSFVTSKEFASRIRPFTQGDIFKNSNPCMDNAYIFPAPTITEIPGGFLRANVTAYGRTNTDGQVYLAREYRGNHLFLNYQIEPIIGSGGKIVNYFLEPSFERIDLPRIIDYAVKKIVVEKSSPVQIDLSTPSGPLPPREFTLSVYNERGNQLNNIVGTNDYVQTDVYEIVSKYYISQYDTVGYGNFNEITIVVRDDFYYSNYKQALQLLDEARKTLTP